MHFAKQLEGLVREEPRALENWVSTDECHFRCNRGKSGHMSYELCRADKPYENRHNKDHHVMLWCASTHEMVRFRSELRIQLKTFSGSGVKSVLVLLGETMGARIVTVKSNYVRKILRVQIKCKSHITSTL